MKTLKQVFGKDFQSGGEEPRGWLPSNAALPLTTAVEVLTIDVRILEAEGGFILEWTFRNSDQGNDSWHQTLHEAENEAEHRFGIEISDWQIADEEF